MYVYIYVLTQIGIYMEKKNMYRNVYLHIMRAITCAGIIPMYSQVYNKFEYV